MHPHIQAREPGGILAQGLEWNKPHRSYHNGIKLYRCPHGKVALAWIGRG
jgi:hypothetical protein